MILSVLDSDIPKEVDEVLMFVSLTTFLLDPGPLWIIKTVQKMTIGWVYAVVSFEKWCDPTCRRLWYEPFCVA